MGDIEPLIGYLTLESAGVVVDMVGHRLVALKVFDLKSASRPPLLRPAVVQICSAHMPTTTKTLPRRDDSADVGASVRHVRFERAVGRPHHDEP